VSSTEAVLETFSAKSANQVRSCIAKTLGAFRVGRLEPERRADESAAGRQRPPWPPDVQRRDVPVPDRLLPPRVGADPLDGQIDLDQAIGISRHICSQVLKTTRKSLISRPSDSPSDSRNGRFIALTRSSDSRMFRGRSPRRTGRHYASRSPRRICAETLSGSPSSSIA
jgi:hypothetical protein